MSTTMTVRLDDDVEDRLGVLAAATQRSKSSLAAEAIRAYVENNEWQVREIQAALKEADSGDFADDKDVTTLAMKWAVVRSLSAAPKLAARAARPAAGPLPCGERHPGMPAPSRRVGHRRRS